MCENYSSEYEPIKNHNRGTLTQPNPAVMPQCPKKMKESTKWKSAKWHSAVCLIFSLKFITPPFSLSLFFFYPFISCFYFQTPQFSLTVLSAAAALSLILSVASSSQSRLPRLVVGPFWGWNCTGGRPSVHWNTKQRFLWKPNQGGVTHCL